MSRPTIPVLLDGPSRRPTGPGLAALGLLCLLLPAPVLPADPQEQKPADKGAQAPPATAGKPSVQKRAPAPPTTPPLRFTDEDLEKYRKPKVAEPEAESEEVADAEEPPTAPPPAALPIIGPPKPPAPKPAPPKPSPPKPHPALVRTPPKAAKLPAEDPLKPWKDREDLENFRNEQLKGLRDRIKTLESQLHYLQDKRLAILDPLRIMPQPRSPEEAAQDAERRPRDLLESVDKEIESVEGELDQAKRDLIAVETRFEHETAPR